jgi:hypothetical protein
MDGYRHEDYVVSLVDDFGASVDWLFFCAVLLSNILLFHQ